MFKCRYCGTSTKKGNYDYEGCFVCQDCSATHNYLHFDNFDIIDGEVRRTSPVENLTESEQRVKLINLIHIIFNNNVNKGAYRLINLYLKKGYSYLDMIRALEYFYIIKKNSTKKSNNNIGIIPYVVEEAREYYELKNRQLFQKYLKMLEASHKPKVEEIVFITEKQTRRQIDMTEL